MIAALRARILLLQIIALFIYLVFDAFGYGLGILAHIATRPLTKTGKFHVGDLIAGRQPIGPNRLSVAERAKEIDKISAAFGGAPPAYTRLVEMTGHYQLKDAAHCLFRAANVVRRPQECNAVREASHFYIALLKTMHPSMEVLFLQSVTGYKGDAVSAAFFADRNGKPKVLLDLSRVSPVTWKTDLGFRLKIYSGGGLAEVTLAKDEVASRVYLIDDPGELQRRDASCTERRCVSRLLLYAYNHEGFRDSATNELSYRNLADITISADMEQRFALYAAVLGKPLTAPKLTLDMSYKPSPTYVSSHAIAHLTRHLDAAMGAGATGRALFSPIGYHVAFGTVYAIMLDGKRHLIFDGGTQYPTLGTDKLIFRWQIGSRLEAVSPITGGQIWVLPLPPTGAVKPMLTVHKATQPTGKPWSWFSDFDAVLGPLAKP